MANFNNEIDIFIGYMNILVSSRDVARTVLL